MVLDAKELDGLVDKVVRFLEEKVDTNYRISVVIAGPPGSGKSTIAEVVCSEINRRYQEYLQQQQSNGGNPIKFNDNSNCGVIDLDSSVDEISRERLKALEENGGINPELVEDLTIKPVKITDKAEKTTTIIGRGGLPNGIKIVYSSGEKDGERPTASLEQIQIAQIVPMDGFHLSRKCLDCFEDPKTAHKRRGSPPTFDSNNYLELCKILAQTANVKPVVPISAGSVWEKISASFDNNMPDIYISSFDHAKKDPSEGALCISKFTRVLIFEGLYLLYDQENWRGIYPTLSETGSSIFWDVTAPTEQLEERVAKRHLKSGLVDSLEAGVRKFRENDLLNAQTISSHRVKVRDDSASITKIDNF